MFIIIFPPQKLTDVNETLNTYLGSNNITDKILEKRLKPCKVSVLSQLREEKHHIYDIQPSNNGRVALITVSEKALVELNTSSGRKIITDVVSKLGTKNVYYHYIEENTSQFIRIINNEGSLPIVQIASNIAKS